MALSSYYQKAIPINPSNSLKFKSPRFPVSKTGSRYRGPAPLTQATIRRNSLLTQHLTMSLSAQISRLEFLNPTRVSTDAWYEVRREDLPRWNDTLLASEASLYQYPFWNEPYRELLLKPNYLAWGTKDDPKLFVCILTVGFGGTKIGVVFRGPTFLQSEAACPEAFKALTGWARKNGYVFIRFTHSDPQVLSRLGEVVHTEDFDAFPFFLDYPVLSPDYVVQQCESEEETLATFDREVRRKLRRAAELGYEFRADDSPEALKKAWPLYQDCSRRKHFRLERPLSVYMETMRLALAHNCARVYSMNLNGKMVGSTLVFRDHTTAHCMLAAFHVEHKNAAVLLHWRSMRDMYHLGANRYNMGPAPGSLARFKQQFCQHPTAYPGAVTAVLNESLYKIWRNAIFPVAENLRPLLRRIVSRVKR